MVMITSVSIDNGTGYNRKSAEVKLASDQNSYERITIPLTEEETAEVVKLVSEIIATRLRLPAIKEKLEAAKSEFSPVSSTQSIMDKYDKINSVVPATIETPAGTASFTPDGYKPDNPKPRDSGSCAIHGSYIGNYCYECAELDERARSMKPDDGPDGITDNYPPM